MVPSVLSASLSWAATLVALPRYLHARHDVRLAAAWRAIALLAAAMTLTIPAIGRAVDRLVQLPNASHWLANALVLGTAQAVEEFLYALDHGTAGSRSRRLVAFGLYVGVAGMLALLLWRAHLTTEVFAFTPATLGHVPPTLIGYQLVYALAFSAVAVRLAQCGWRYARTSRDVTVSLGAALSAVGALWAVAWFGVGFVALALPPATSRALFGAQSLCSVMAVLCTTGGATLPLWSRRVGLHALLLQAATLHSLVRLQPLWRELTAAVPDVVLPTTLSIPAAVRSPENLELLLNRRVIEILDARRDLLTSSNSASRSADIANMSGSPMSGREDARGSVAVGGTPPDPIPSGTWRDQVLMLAAACVEARALAQAIALRTQGASLGVGDALRPSATQSGLSVPRSGAAVAYQPRTFDDQVRYLEQVAVASRRLGRRRWLTTACARLHLRWLCARRSAP